MSYNGSGTFNINTAGQPVVTGTVISSTAFNALTADLGTGLSTAITKNGQTTVTANIPFNGYKLTGIAVATASGDALSYGQAATVSALTDSALTSGRVPYASTAGLFVDSANLTFNGTTLTANTIGAFTLGGTVAGGGNQLNNVIIGTTTPLAGAFTTLSATGNTTLSGAIVLDGTSINSFFDNDPAAYIFRTGGSAGDFSSESGHLVLQPRGSTGAARSVIIGAGATTTSEVARFSSTGLAVTGTLSATGTLSGGTSGTGYSFSGSAPATSLALDSSGNLGLGVTPSAWTTLTVLQIKNASLYGFANEGGLYANTYYASGSFRYIATAAATGYDSNAAAGQHRWFTAPSGTAGNAITFTQSLAVGKGTTLALEGATSATGTGIAFPATQNASTDANTLDDYEEGSWTYNFTATTGTITKTATYLYGYYTKVGRVVTITGFLQVTSVSSPTGVLTLTGLPFAIASTGNRETFVGGGIYGSSLAVGSVSPLMVSGSAGSSSLTISKFVTGSSADLAGDVVADTRFQISFSYFS